MTSPERTTILTVEEAARPEQRGGRALTQGAHTRTTKRGNPPVAITLTDKAVEELKTIMAKEVESENLSADAALRLMVVGGGCSGFSYKMGFDESVKNDDTIVDVSGVKVVVDQKSNLYLDGVEVDYHDGLMGRGFVFNNPNASGTCGCGESFSV